MGSLALRRQSVKEMDNYEGEIMKQATENYYIIPIPTIKKKTHGSAQLRC